MHTQNNNPTWFSALGYTELVSYIQMFRNSVFHNRFTERNSCSFTFGSSFKNPFTPGLRQTLRPETVGHQNRNDLRYRWSLQHFSVLYNVHSSRDCQHSTGCSQVSNKAACSLIAHFLQPNGTEVLHRAIQFILPLVRILVPFFHLLLGCSSVNIHFRYCSVYSQSRLWQSSSK